MLSCLVMCNTYMQSFQYKISNNVLFLNKKTSYFWNQAIFCSLYNEKSFHIFYECDYVKCLWQELVQCFQNSLNLPILIASGTSLKLHFPSITRNFTEVSEQSIYNFYKINLSRSVSWLMNKFQVLNTMIKVPKVLSPNFACNIKQFFTN